MRLMCVFHKQHILPLLLDLLLSSVVELDTLHSAFVDYKQETKISVRDYVLEVTGQFLI